jgi:hypothetical protein
MKHSFKANETYYSFRKGATTHPIQKDFLFLQLESPEPEVIW